ncbi:hypothetical protein GCM10014719_69760 [Planomonospora parontospora subsp. antibiotica]|nr:hypothetical protein GCM10014719_69760 [Planomonospora parontospora subsp. antibiotica]GII20154.1 hypothetical protein Ppa05_68800 [Planomonospora parontospora subsp. antibiotica]
MSADDRPPHPAGPCRSHGAVAVRITIGSTTVAGGRVPSQTVNRLTSPRSDVLISASSAAA